VELTIGANSIVPTLKLELNIQIFGIDLSELDFSAYILSNQNQKVRGDDDMIFYGQLHNRARNVVLSQINSNTVQLNVNLPSIDTHVGKIAFCVTMANVSDTFSKVNHLKLKVLDKNQTYLTAKINGSNRSEAALIIGEFYRHQENWKFRLVAQGFNGGLKPLAEHFGVEIADDSALQAPPQHENAEQNSHQPSETTSILTNTLKDIFSSPLKMIEKRKNLKEFQKRLSQILSNNHLDSHGFQNLKDFCLTNQLELRDALSFCEKQINDFILQVAQYQDRSVLIQWGSILNVHPNIMRQIDDILIKKYELQFKQLLSEALKNHQLTVDEMRQIDQFCIQHGLDKQHMFKQYGAMINNFLHFTLVNVVADQIVTQDEINLINQLCNYFKPDQNIVNEINATIQRVNKISKIKKGDVNPIQTNEIVVKNSEIVYLNQANVGLTIPKKNKEYHRGEFFVTSERLIFKSDKPKNIPLSNIISYENFQNSILITSKTASQSGDFYIGNDADIVEAYIDQAVKRFHRQLNLRQTAGDTRYIPQEIRNTVWQRCNGKCVECSSSSYLEFDHIIPFSKGGSNSENNIQLLCRACNLSKSDRI
jgi:stress response protein SCP2